MRSRVSSTRPQRAPYTLLALLVWLGVGVAPYSGMLGAHLPSSEPPLEASTTVPQAGPHDEHGKHAHHDPVTHAAEAPTQPAEHDSSAHDPHHGLHCALCVVGAGLLALSVSLPFRPVSGFALPQRRTSSPRPRPFTHHRSRAPPGALVTF